MDEHGGDVPPWKSELFHENIRYINNQLAFASIDSTCQVKNINNGGAPWVYRVHGQIHRQIYPADVPRAGMPPAFSQLYFLDVEESIEQIEKRIQNTYLADLTTDLHLLMRKHNPYAETYKMLHEHIEELQQRNQEIPVFSIHFNQNMTAQQLRTYNAPPNQVWKRSEVAAILVGNVEDRDMRERTLTITSRYVRHIDNHKTILCTDPNALALSYPLLYPFGDGSWRKGMAAWFGDPPPPPPPRPQRDDSPPPRNFADDEAEEEGREEGDFGGENPGDRPRREPKEWAPKKKLSMLDYFAYHLHYRKEGAHSNNHFSPLHWSGRLFQQWCVDAFSKIEEQRLEMYRSKDMQKKLRADTYSNLQEQLRRHLRNNPTFKAGRTVVLPSTFVGGPRHMSQEYMDAMAIARKTAPPDLFITMTANSCWQEVLDSIPKDANGKPLQEPADRPDIVARVFRLKLEELVQDLFERHIFGKVAGYAWTIEYQKRGLPHVHILIILKNASDKPRTAEHVDKLISAQIPDPDEDPELFDLVKRNMIHGPCGDLNPRCVCMKHGKCTKRFPAQFCERTNPDRDGYPEYRRPQNGPVIPSMGRNGRFTNVDCRWVVPYNPYLLRKYKCHLNVQLATSIEAFKYIYKYIYKGQDKAEVRLWGRNKDVVDLDEVKSFMDARYLCAPEASSRMLQFDTHRKSHYIHRLPVHLENEQHTVFEEGHLEAAVAAGPRETGLTAFFDLNAGVGVTPEDASLARTLLYHDIPQHFRYEKGCWKRRKHAVPTTVDKAWGSSKPIIGRMHNMPVREIEKYALRILLLHIKGPTCFEDLRKVQELVTNDDGTEQENEVVYETFKEAAIRRGLLDDDKEWDRCLADAIKDQMPASLRTLFASILIHCKPTSPLELWDKYKKYFYNERTYSTEAARNDHLAYKKIQEIVREFDSTMSLAANFGIPRPNGDFADPDVQQEIQNHAHEGRILLEKLTPTQRQHYDTIMAATDNGNGGAFFLDGPGGSGKSFLYNTLRHNLLGAGKSVVTCASTGVAAILLNGVTQHKMFGTPVPCREDSVSKIRHGTKEARDILDASLIIWDESTMAHKDNLHCMDRLLRDLTDNDIPFGGKCIVLGGDFRQCLPVVQRGTSAMQVCACIKSSRLWRHFTQLSLKDNIRSANPAYSAFTLSVGENSTRGRGVNFADFPEIPIVRTDDDLITEIYGHEINQNTLLGMRKRVILSPTCARTMKLNEAVLSRLPTQAVVRNSIDTAILNPGDDFNMVSTEHLHTLNPNGMPPHALTLKKGGVYMLLRNMCIKQGLCNGSRFVILDCTSPNVLKCELIPPVPLPDGQSPLQFFLPRVTLTPPDGYYIPFTRKQFPILPAFAQTINKSQGGTYERVGLDLFNPVFSHGQLYVALSRVSDFSCLRILLPNQETDTENIVCDEILDANFRPEPQPAPDNHTSASESDSDDIDDDGNQADDEDQNRHPSELDLPNDDELNILDYYYQEQARIRDMLDEEDDYEEYLRHGDLPHTAIPVPATPPTPPLSPQAS